MPWRRRRWWWKERSGGPTLQGCVRAWRQCEQGWPFWRWSTEAVGAVGGGRCCVAAGAAPPHQGLLAAAGALHRHTAAVLAEDMPAPAVRGVG
eukprot:scaffold57431_cov17-Tisochrysis_lutea.AAC.2